MPSVTSPSARPRLALIALALAGPCACGLTISGVASVPNDAGDPAAPEAGAATPDAGEDAKPDASGFCASLALAPTFCADFDGPSPLAGWDRTLAASGATTEPSSTLFMSMPRSLHTTTTSGARAAVQKTFHVQTGIDVDYDVQFPIKPTGAAGYSALRLRTMKRNGGVAELSCLFINSIGGGQSYFQDGDTGYSVFVNPGPAIGAWHHVSVKLRIGVATTTIESRVDEVDYVWTGGVLKNAWATDVDVQVDVGLGNVFLVMNAETYVDNVVIRTQ